MSTELASTTALVTGASSGIGAATARSLAARGARVALVARRRDRLDQVVADITDAGGSAFAVEADLTDEARAQAAVHSVVAESGRLDILVNNAGLMLSGPIADAPDGEWDRMLDINVRGLLYVTRAAIGHLTDAARDSPRGVADIVTISSTAGRVARPGTGIYSLTKFGVNAFSESLRQELLAARIRVGVVEPGTVDTELLDHVRDGAREAMRANVDAIVPLRPDDIADAVTYMVTRDRRVAVNEMLVRSAEQTW
ncbi:SDR family NAD(P)-dependent oxidoreductase [Williamsia maris]|uniref:NADP-dependent 3-hydroxy acid dehydrogenase YdfG n=1 Tax=Williamsia maris TaxID=72806 RepID=A0ABT1H869_9NOCA|nr:SDR family NAD(P)-dependent oxidoreductase [Williamsia maris]MCP2174460.1 NADP-dependent 3-hydroxy acid dehydrogenase YdfG [Williamsia maris]